MVLSDINCQENSNEKLTKTEKDRTAVIAVLSFFSIFFFMAFEQSGISLTLLAEQHVDRVIPFLGSLHYSASWFQTINPLAILILALYLLHYGHYLEKRDMNLQYL